MNHQDEQNVFKKVEQIPQVHSVYRDRVGKLIAITKSGWNSKLEKTGVHGWCDPKYVKQFALNNAAECVWLKPNYTSDYSDYDIEI